MSHSHKVISFIFFSFIKAVDILLNIAYNITHLILHILIIIIKPRTDVNMIETSSKRKRMNKKRTNQSDTIFKRGVIDANWQKLLSSTLMDKSEEKPQKEETKNNYTGTFRRARKKKNKDSIDNVKNLQILNINKVPVVSSENSDSINEKSKAKDNNKRNKITKFLAMDCEMVGVGYEGGDHMLARVSIVNKFGDCIYDKFVKAREEVVDYRTNVSGIRKEDLLNGDDFEIVQKEVSELIRGKILVGHSLKNDLGVLFLSHPKHNIRDTSRYKPFRKITKGSTPSLKRLAKEILGIDIQHGEHSSVEDAKAVMQLYCTVAKNWEQALGEKRGYSKKFVES
ncbi:uncharacterized protein LOC126780052 [Nymphalis io]|uniref:uncharacterized protein LOC126780052 n=1 Tax=Inachis io TaxID=171585 RepID=UPI002169EC82|nr:uncharacterized protein LOC126780052 [Nymphalis io]